MERFDTLTGKWIAERLPGDPSVEMQRHEDRVAQAYKDKIAKLEQDLAAYQKAYSDYVKDNERIRQQLSKFISLFSTCFCETCRTSMLKWQAGGQKQSCVGCRMGKVFKRLVGPKKKIVRP